MPPVDDDFTQRIAIKPGCDTPRTRGASLTCLMGSRVGQTFSLRTGVNVIGRASDNQVSLALPGLSRKHASIEERSGAYFLKDLGSTNGTVCRDEPVMEELELREGDRIVLAGTVVLRFNFDDDLEQQLRSQLYELATRDPLTNAHNRRFFEERLDSEWPWAIRHERCFAVLMIDIDHFKRINDTWGHPAGDEVLRQLTEVVGKHLRREDLFARLGGEEFVVLCRATNVIGAAVLANRICRAVQSNEFLVNRVSIPVTVSVGVATSKATSVQGPGDVIELADKALYEAKRLGRNRAHVIEDGE